jgi:16S rRNA (adenine1518-N6/adenine1519-N6)-dimethyltransferase
MQKSNDRNRTPGRTRALGQHMLVSEEIADRIISSSQIGPYDAVLEIGTGGGILTQRLARFARKVYSFEIDKKLYENALRSLASYENVELVYGDAFKNEYEYPFDVCVTNLPYSQSLKFVKWLSQLPTRFRLAVATLQSEFAEKLLSEPAMRTYRAVSVIAQLSFDMNSLFHLGREVFEPQPQVMSEVVRFSPKALENWPILKKNEIVLLNFLFSFRGRLLSSAFRKLEVGYSGFSFPNNLMARRIETLTPREFCLILEQIGAAHS